MIDYEYSDLFWQGSIDKQWKIEYDDGIITNDELFSQSIEISESLCSEKELRFGSCDSSSFRFKVGNVVRPLIGMWLTVSVVIDHHNDAPLQIGRYKVASDKPTADRRHREIVAYDAMHDIINADVSGWYNSILPNENSTVTLKQFRESFVRYFGLTEFLPKGSLVNDGMPVSRTIAPDQISGRDVITAICEINGCFGHIGRDGKFHYIYLPQGIQGLYPANFLYPDHVPEQWDYLPQAETGHLYPQDPKGTSLGKGRYIKCQYEDYVVRQINKLQIRKEENDIGVIYPAIIQNSKDNCYVIEDNFLVYGKGTAELNMIAENIYSKITGIVYRPFSADCAGNPCLEVGDPVILPTKYDIVESYILSRTLKGIQALRDDYKAKGSERYSEQVNGIQKSILQLKGKSNTLERTIEETKSELKDTEKDLRSTITQTASEIRSEVSEADNALSSRITQNANSISSEVSRATTEEGNLSSRIEQNAEGITQRVVKGTVSSEISQEADKVEISANRLIVNSSQFSLDGNGNARFGGNLDAANGSFSGNVDATSGTFRNVTIYDNCTVAGEAVHGTIGNGVGWNGDTIGGNYIGSGISGSYVTRGTVSNSRITSALSDKTLTNNIDGNSIDLYAGNYHAYMSATGVYFAQGNSPISVVGTSGISTSGTKNRVTRTENYGERLLYCYEMSGPMFGDIGEGETDETGTCMVFLDDILSETIDTGCQYQVFLQAYSPGNCYVSERTPSYFVVKGDPDLKFGWELKAIQKGYDTVRLQTMEYEEQEPDVLAGLNNYMKQLLFDAEEEEIL